MGSWDLNDNLQNVECLDKEISIDELEKALGKLKRNKSHGLDDILNEFLIFSSDILKIVILKLFNTLLEISYFPSIWASGEMIPVFKSGDPNVSSNYRGITLISCIGKLFTNILNERLNEWAELNEVYSDVQFGFRKNRNTSDCLFVLQGLIEHIISKSNPFYCAFIDLQRAFDNTNRGALWYKLHENQ